jgi:pyruvate dehydrogenase E1 component alpha subunit
MYAKKFLSDIYKNLYRIRVFETECIKLYRQGLIRGYFHPYLGEEAIAVGVCAALRSDDYIASTHRGHGHCIAKGAEFPQMVAELLGKKTGYCSGFGGSMHIADLSRANLGANAIVAGNIPHGVGAALGISMRGEERVSVVFSSDGASNNGVFSETLNLAAIWQVPLLLVIENNQYAVSTPIEEATREPDLFKRGIGLGVESFSVNGNDVLEVYENTKKSVEKCRAGKGPILMEAKTYRHGGHHVNDPGLYLPEDKLEFYKRNDPVSIGRRYLIDKGKATEKEVKAIEAAIEQEMAVAIEFAKQSPEPTMEEFLQMVETY